MTMKVTFEQKDRTKILESIQQAMSGRKLGDIVKFGLAAGKLEVVISKMGTSTLQFKESTTPTGLAYALESEKIAFTHKAFKDEVTKKIVQVIEQAGGKVSA
jgi:hypothetical protein